MHPNVALFNAVELPAVWRAGLLDFAAFSFALDDVLYLKLASPDSDTSKLPFLSASA